MASTECFWKLNPQGYSQLDI